MLKFLIIRIGWDFRYGMNSRLSQLLKETNKPWISILEAAGINKFYAFTNTIVIDTAIIYTLADGSPRASTIVFYNLTINIAATMATLVKIIIAQSDIMAILFQAFHLIEYLLRDSAVLRKTMINEK